MRLTVQDLELEVGAFHLGPVALDGAEGEYLAVLGPSGAGKTLTLEAIAGLRPVRRGRVLINDRDVTAAPPEARGVGFLYQDSLLFPHLSVRDNLAYGAHRIPRARREPTIARLAALLGIEPLMARKPRGLSGGERQRVALGRALAAQPRLLLLDEPMAALDPNSRMGLRRTLHELHRSLGTTTVHVTHNFAEAMALGDRVAIFIEGRVLQIGPPEAVFNQPASPAVMRFLRSARSLGAEQRLEPIEEALTIAPNALRLTIARDVDGAPTAQIEAEGVQFLATAPPSESAQAALEESLPGRVVSVERDGGGRTRIAMNVGIEMRAEIDAHDAAAHGLAPGSAVRIRLPRD